MFALRARTSVLRSPARTLFARYESTEATPTPAPAPTSESQNFRGRRAPRQPMPRISRTHFLTIPLYEHSLELRAKLEAFRESIVGSSIQGLTADSVIPRFSQFLELRLGSLNIEGFKPLGWFKRRPFKGQGNLPPTRAEQTPIPLEELKEVLQGIKAQIQNILTADGGDGVLHVPLGRLRPLLHGSRRTFNPQKVNILFLEPDFTPNTDRLRAVNELVFKTLQQAGMWVDVHRPSTLSLTLANVRYHGGRATKPYDERVPFDVMALYESQAFRAVAGAPPSAAEGEVVDAATPRPVVLGEGLARSLHLIPIAAAEPDAEGAQPVADDEPIKPDWKLEL